MSQIVLYFLHSTSVLSFNVDIVLTLSTSWNTFLWVEFFREYGPNSDSDFAVPEIHVF